MSTSPITKPSEALRAARELLSDPKRWTQGEHARTDEGQVTDPTADDAFCFCAEGALLNVTNENSFFGVKRVNLSERSLNFVRKAIDKDQVYEWNDSRNRKHLEVVAVFARAIALAEEACQ